MAVLRSAQWTSLEAHKHSSRHQYPYFDNKISTELNTLIFAIFNVVRSHAGRAYRSAAREAKIYCGFLGFESRPRGWMYLIEEKEIYQSIMLATI